MIDRERLNDAAQAPSGYGSLKGDTANSQGSPSSSPPTYDGMALDPLHRRVLVGVTGTVVLAIWIFAWSIVSLVEGRNHTKIIPGIITVSSLATLAFRAPVLVAALFKTPYEVAQKFDVFVIRRRALLFQHIFTIAWGAFTCWSIFAITHSTRRTNWLNIAITVLCADMTFLQIMTYIAAKKVAKAQIIHH